MTVEQFVPLVSSLGFPIVVSLWFMFRTEKVIAANTKAMDTNTVLLNQLMLRLK
jgi:hypothetical protein